MVEQFDKHTGRTRDVPTVPCIFCGVPSTFTGTKRCNNCWELEHRMRGNVALSLKILKHVHDEAPVKSTLLTETIDRAVALTARDLTV
jgi:hypothetical protein